MNKKRFFDFLSVILLVGGVLLHRELSFGWHVLAWIPISIGVVLYPLRFDTMSKKELFSRDGRSDHSYGVASHKKQESHSSVKTVASQSMKRFLYFRIGLHVCMAIIGLCVFWISLDESLVLSGLGIILSYQGVSNYVQEVERL